MSGWQLIEMEKPLNMRERLRLIEIAHSTKSAELRDAALALLRETPAKVLAL